MRKAIANNRKDIRIDHYGDHAWNMRVSGGRPTIEDGGRDGGQFAPAPDSKSLHVSPDPIKINGVCAAVFCDAGGYCRDAPAEDSRDLTTCPASLLEAFERRFVGAVVSANPYEVERPKGWAPLAAAGRRIWSRATGASRESAGSEYLTCQYEQTPTPMGIAIPAGASRCHEDG